MKSVILLSLLLASPAAFAVKVGEQIQIPRSQIQCQESGSRPRFPRCPYCYEIPSLNADSSVTITLDLDGVQEFTGKSSHSCAELAQFQGDPATAEVTQVSTRKIGELVHRLIELRLAGVTVSGQTN